MGNREERISDRSVTSEKAPVREQQYYPARNEYRNSPTGASAAVPPREHIVPIFVAGTDVSPRLRAFLDELQAKRAHIVQVTYDRVGQNPKELTVFKGEYLEVCNYLDWITVFTIYANIIHIDDLLFKLL